MTLTPQQKKALNSDGFLILPDFFSPAEISPVCTWIDTMVDDLSRHLVSKGLIKETYEDKPFRERLIWIEKEYPQASVCIHSLGVFGPALLALATKSKLIRLVQSILGPDIGLHPVWNIRAKTPENPLATVPWHQDTAYLLPDSEKTPQITTWIPLVNIRRENGPLVFVKGGHRSGHVFPHRPEHLKGDPQSWYLYIDEKDLPTGERPLCQVQAGGLILFNQLIPHCCLENVSDHIRWSLDLRWQNPRLNNGMGHHKPCLPLSGNTDHKAPSNWKGWALQKRPGQSPEGYSSTLSGPWLKRWDSAPG